jgi:Fur family ferric uptake transcriptional regulator
MKLKFIFKYAETGGPMQYRTKQRDEILRFFMDHADRCFSVKEVRGQVDAGEATVFRAITALTEAGMLRKFTVGSGRGESAFYQYADCGDRPEHIHLKCEQCGELFHMDCAFMETILSHFRDEHGFEVDCGRTVIYGICGTCRASGKNGNAAGEVKETEK